MGKQKGSFGGDVYRLIVVLLKYENKLGMKQKLAAFQLAQIMDSSKSEEILAEKGLDELNDEVNIRSNDVLVGPAIYKLGITPTKLIKEISNYMSMANMNLTLSIYYPDIRTGEKKLLSISVKDLLTKKLSELLKPAIEYLNNGKYLNRGKLAKVYFKNANPNTQTGFADSLEKGDLKFTEKTYDKEDENGRDSGRKRKTEGEITTPET